MNIILLRPQEVISEHVELRGYRADHIVKILRARRQQSLHIGLLNGPTGTGTVVAIDKKHPRLVRLKVQFDQTVPVQPRLDLVIALPRPIMLKRIFRDATTFGVGSFFIVNAGRVEKSFWSSSLIAPQKYRKPLITGLEQGVHTRLPEVSFYQDFRLFVEQRLLHISQEYSQLIVAHPGHPGGALRSCGSAQNRTLLAIGPEGGWLDYEIQALEEAGFQQFSFTESILRVDTAVIAFMAAILSARYP